MSARNLCVRRSDNIELVITRSRMGPSLGFVSNVFILGSNSVTYYGLFYCTIGFVLRQCFSMLFEFQVIRKGCIFSPFLPFVLLFLRSCCNSAFILELHRCSKGRSISRVQTENCYYFRSISEWASHCHLKCVLRSIS